MTLEARRNRFKLIVGQVVAMREKMAERPFAGALDGPPLEDTTRRLALDPLIDALGWDLGYDIAQEARVVGETTLFIDYLGVHRETRDAEMIFEAKAWDAPMISGRIRGAGPSVLASQAAEHVRLGRNGQPPVTKDWMKKIVQLHDYVVLTKEQTGVVVRRVAISSGQWMMVFKNPEATFLGSAAASGDDVLVLSGKDMIARSDEIYRMLAREHLSDLPRAPISQSKLPYYLPRGLPPKGLYRAVWIGHAEGGTVLKSKPSLVVHPAAVVERHDGALIQVVDHDNDFDVPSNAALLQHHLEAMSRASDALIASICSVLEIVPLVASEIEDFPGFRSDDPSGRSAALRSPIKSGNLIVATGNSPHYLRPEPEIANCVFHSHVACAVYGKATQPVVSVRSHQPPSFFTTGEAHHCAHVEVFDEKEGLPCPLAPVEERLCCRACTLQPRCWSQRRLARFPCGATSRLEGATVDP